MYENGDYFTMLLDCNWLLIKNGTPYSWFNSAYNQSDPVRGEYISLSNTNIEYKIFDTKVYLTNKEKNMTIALPLTGKWKHKSVLKQVNCLRPIVDCQKDKKVVENKNCPEFRKSI
jgi:hypothetical protein